MLQVIITADGSPTLFVSELNEHYHSVFGAFTEAVHVFEKNGLHYFLDLPQINVFELGFGTGLNALVAFYFSKTHHKKIYYESIENSPLPYRILEQISYANFFKSSIDELKIIEKKIKESDWNVIIELSSHFSIRKVKDDINSYSPRSNYFNLIFFDAFGPRAQSELWRPEILEKMYYALSPGGALVTYCASGQLKRNLKTLGFKVKSPPGPPGKREITVAHKN